MHSRFFVQSVAVLFEGAPAIAEVVAALDGFDVERTRPPRPERSWVGGHPEAVVVYRRELNGLVIVDSVDAPWPDDMGDPETDLPLFGAWTLGAFGPQVFPGNLERACRASAPDAATAAGGHRGVVRMRLSYVLGAGEDAPLWPDGADPLEEILFLARAALTTMELPGALAYFNPNGEVLATRGGVVAGLEGPGAPIELLSAVRQGDLAHAPGWGISDTVGMGQLGLPDLELTYPDQGVEPLEISRWIRSRQVDLLDHGDALGQAWTERAPPGGWRCLGPFEEPLLAPPRATLRFCSKGPAHP